MRKKMETVTDFIFLVSKIIVNSDCSHEIKGQFLLGRKAMTNLDNVLKSRDITLSTKVHIVKAMVFPVVIHGCESWTIKKAEHWRMDVHELVLEKTLESPLDIKEINPVNPKGNKPWILIRRTDADAETPILWPPNGKRQLIGKDPDAGRLRTGGEVDDRGQKGCMESLTEWTWVWASSGRLLSTGKPGMLQSMGLQRVRHDWVMRNNYF